MNIEACYRFLWKAYEEGRAVNRDIRSMTNPECLNESDVIKRLKGPDPTALKWLMEAAVGDVRFFARYPYHDRIFHSFGNIVVQDEELEPGTTHVAVGFLDLAALAASCQWAAWEGDCVEGVAPLVWVGYDCSVYAVAKTLVVAQMLREGCETAHILQVINFDTLY